MSEFEAVDRDRELAAGNVQQRAVAKTLARQIGEALDTPYHDMTHDHLLHILYPSQIEYDPGSRDALQSYRIQLWMDAHYKEAMAANAA